MQFLSFQNSDLFPYKLTMLLIILAGRTLRAFYINNYHKTHQNKVLSIETKKEKTLVFLLTISYTFFCFVWIFTDLFSFAQIRWSEPFHISGAVFLIAGLVLYYYVHKFLGNNFSNKLEIRKNHELVSDGPYRWIRHPMYTATWLMTIGYFLISGNWLVGLVTNLGTLILCIDRIKVEEKMMTEQFGQQYIDYSKKTSRLFPYIY